MYNIVFVYVHRVLKVGGPTNTTLLTKQKKKKKLWWIAITCLMFRTI